MHLDNTAAKDSVVVVVAQGAVLLHCSGSRKSQMHGFAFVRSATALCRCSAGTGLNCVFDLIQVAWARYQRAVAARSIDAANLLPVFPGWEGEVSPARKLPVPLPAPPALTTSVTAAGQGLRVSVLACFESEKSVIERAALSWFHANCPNIRVVFNVSRPMPGGGLRVASDAAPPVLSGPLTASKLVSLLPRSDLTAICCCGSPSFVEDVREIYAPLGLPRAFFTVVT